MQSITFKETNVADAKEQFIPGDIYQQIIEHMPIVCVDVALIRDNKVYLIKRNNEPLKDKYWLQGGRLNKNETLEACAIRKGAEELNIPEENIIIKRNLGTHATLFGNSAHGEASTHTVNITFQIDVKEGTELSFDQHHHNSGWFTYEDLQTAGDTSEHHVYVRDLLEDILTPNI